MQGKRLPYRTRQLMLDYANRILAIYADLNDTFADDTGRPAGNIRIGASTTIAQYLLPGILASFRRRYPEIDVELANGNTEQIEETRRRGTYRHRYDRGKSHGPCPALRTLHARRTGTGNLCIEFGFPRRRSGHGNTRSPPPRHPGERFRDAGHPHGSPRPLRSGTAIHEH